MTSSALPSNRPCLDAPPVGILDQHGLDVRLPGLEHVRAGAVGLVGGDHVLLFRIVLRPGRAVGLAPGTAHDVDRSDVLELDRVGPGGREFHRQVVDLSRHAGSDCVRAQLRGVGAGALIAEYDVIGRERGAVVKLDAGTQLEAPGGRRRLLPRCGERRTQRELLVALYQRLVDENIDVVGQVLVLRVRVGRLQVAAARPAQRLARRGRGCRDRRQGRERECECDQTQHRKSPSSAEKVMINLRARGVAPRPGTSS